MKKIMVMIIASVLTVSVFAMGNFDGSGKPVVAVSIVPEKAFVEAVAGNDFEVVLAIPPGSSPASYEPSPQEKANLNRAIVYFAIGVPIEHNSVLPTLNPETKVIHLGKIVSKVYPYRMFSDAEEQHEVCPVCGEVHIGQDPHIWLSPKRAIVMVETIRDTLSTLNPNNAETYVKNANAYIAELKKVDMELKDTLKAAKNKAFFVFHPAFGYFADDYGLKQYSLEAHGKEATPEHMMEMVNLAKKINAKAIFYQAEIDSSQSKAFAEEIGGKTIQLEPLAFDYIPNLKKIAKLLLSVN